MPFALMLFMVLVAVATLWLLRFLRRQAKKGALLGYNPLLGISTPYDMAKDATAIESGQKVFKPTVSSFLVMAIILAALGG